MIYCERKLGVERIPGSDGQCGPSNGPQCSKCQERQRSIPDDQFLFVYVARRTNDETVVVVERSLRRHGPWTLA